MSIHLRLVSYSLVVLILCIGRGDGRWKTKVREKVEHDIILFRKMAETIEHDIENFYDDYPNEEKMEDKFYYKKDVYDTDRDIKKFKDDLQLPSHFNLLNTSNERKRNSNRGFSHHNNEKSGIVGLTPITPLTHDSYVKNFMNYLAWPKFEDMLFSIGKRYDWKNDRWIKVKNKLKNTSVTVSNSKDRSEILSKHKFIYRFVKLNKTKSKRNIVLAVKAVKG